MKKDTTFSVRIATSDLDTIRNKNPPAKPVVFKRRAKPYVTSHVSRGVGTV